jgi:PA14 domain-containing protein/PKD domain-containing protein
LSAGGLRRQRKINSRRIAHQAPEPVNPPYLFDTPSNVGYRIDARFHTLPLMIPGRVNSLLIHPPLLIVLLSIALVLSSCPSAEGRVDSVSVPTEIKSTEFTILANGKPIDVAHAAASYSFASIDATGPVKISISASQDGFWDHGVDIQPWRLGIRPLRKGRTIEFLLRNPAKLSISRPEYFLNRATMLFLFVSRPPALPSKQVTAKAGFHFVGPGVHRQSLNPKSGDTWYLAPGSVIFGSLNLWKVQNVTVTGRGVIVYDGPQNPEDDDGWMQKPDWHCIGALEAHHIHISGLTCVVRSRTWSIQMKDSADFEYDDLRVIGGNPGNANQDGMDWLGGGNTVVRDSFFRASDDVLAMQGNWDGYEHDALVAPGHDVSNILVENSVLSTSISNIVRAGWPQKTFNSRNFTLRDSDILHGGIGSCGLPFALFTFWGAQGAKGQHSGYTFENLWLDDWYSLFQIEQDEPDLRGFTFHNIWALGQPPLIASRLQGQVKDVHLENVKYGQSTVTANTDVPTDVTGGAQQPTYSGSDNGLRAAFRVAPEVLEPETRATFTADAIAGRGAATARYTWFFGDGTSARGRSVRHRYTDAMGTELDGTDASGKGGTGSGGFRVMLQVEDKQGHEDWAEQNVAVVGRWRDPAAKVKSLPGLQYHIYPGTWPELPAFATEAPTSGGVASKLTEVNTGGFTRFAIVYEGFIEVPRDGGYSFSLMARDGARLVIDGQALAQTGPPFGEVCGSPVNALRYARGTIGLRAGKHLLRLEALESMSPGSPRLIWEGPGIGISDVPASALSHANVAVLIPKPSPPVSTVSP